MSSSIERPLVPRKFVIAYGTGQLDRLLGIELSHWNTLFNAGYVVLFDGFNFEIRFLALLLSCGCNFLQLQHPFLIHVIQSTALDHQCLMINQIIPYTGVYSQKFISKIGRKHH